MDLSINLLNNYVDVKDQDIRQLAEKITRIGHEVEGIHSLAKGSNLLTIGFVKECKPHPDSDHLNICQVEIQPGKVVQIVCGAPNVAVNQKVIVANVGCDLGNGFVIKKGNIRGEESNGMICSLAELGLDGRFITDEQRAGIEILPDDAPLGNLALEYLNLDDEILEIGLTPNRSDCMAIVCFAYEVGALLNRPVKLPAIKTYSEKKSDIKVKVETDLCSFFGAKLVKGIVIKESPQWLKSALMASGIKPINNVVDISNFVMLETGQPIHMYDYDKLDSKEFIVKTGFNCQCKMLDDLEYQVKENDLVVSTDNKVGCLAGVMGSSDTKIDDNTKNIVIEVANFDGPTLRETARRLNLLTDASSRFIKGAIDSSQSLNILNRCVDLLMQLAQGQEVYETVSTELTVNQNKITLTTDKVNGLLGTEIKPDEIADIFTRLKFDYELVSDKFIVSVPSYRKDITMAADLIEEVARMIGYDTIPSTLPEMSMTIGRRKPQQEQKEVIRNLLVDQGLHETITYTLTSPSYVDDFNLFHQGKDIKLSSPLGEERSVTRKSLIPSLLQVVKYNNSYNQKDVNLFEISTTYDQEMELRTLGIVMSGTYQELSFKQIKYTADYFLVKGLIETIFARLGINESRYQLERVESTNQNYHPGQAAYIIINKQRVGVIGKIHPLMAKKYDVKDVFIAQLNLSALLDLKTGQIKFKEILQYPSVTRDIALVMAKDVPTYNVVRTIIQASKQLVKEAKIFDVYEGEHIADNQKSVAIKLILQDPKGTLDDKVVNDTIDTILKVVEKEYKATIRG